jgi:hypothetical protein
VISLINGNFGFNFGFSWGYSQTNGNSEQCCSDPGGVCQIWSQTQYGWLDSQTQEVYGDSCIGDNAWGPWSTYQHANWALSSGNDIVNFGCSSGYQNVQC